MESGEGKSESECVRESSPARASKEQQQNGVITGKRSEVYYNIFVTDLFLLQLTAPNVAYENNINYKAATTETVLRIVLLLFFTFQNSKSFLAITVSASDVT